MAYYLVSARPKPELMYDLEGKLSQRTFVALEPFGRALTNSLESARRLPDGSAVWEEEDYCRPPLAQERKAVLDEYFDEISVEPVQQGGGWQRIEELPLLFPALVGGR